MKTKKESVTLIDLRHVNGNEKAFKVAKAVNTLAYQIATYKSVDFVQGSLNYNDNITITIIPQKGRAEM